MLETKKNKGMHEPESPTSRQRPHRPHTVRPILLAPSPPPQPPPPLSLPELLDVALNHSTLSLTRRRIDLGTDRAVSTQSVQQTDRRRLPEGQDARHRRDNAGSEPGVEGESCAATRVQPTTPSSADCPAASRIHMPSRAALPHLNRKWPQKGSK